MPSVSLLSVVVVNWNSRDDLARCLRSLAAQSEPLELVVVDNGSSDDSTALVRAEFPQAILLAEQDNLGFAEGCNRGIARTSGAWVCLLNNDAAAEPGWASALAAAARDASAACGMLQSLMLYRDRPGTVNSTGIEVGRRGGGRDRDEGRPRAACLEPAEIFCPTGGAAAYRRTMLEAVRLERGYLDPEHFLYYEDLDLGWRARLCGWNARYVPESVVQHVWHGSTRRHPEAWLDQLAELNRLRTLIKNGSARLLARALPSGIARAARKLVRRDAVDVPPLAQQPLDRALLSAWQARAEVSTLERVDRRELERRWLVD